VAQGTSGRLNSGEPLGQIAIVPTTTLPQPSAFVVVGGAYDILPDTAVLDKAMSLTITYDRTLVPAGVAESDLGIATCDRGPESGPPSPELSSIPLLTRYRQS
jgi:hypothetical protein